MLRVTPSPEQSASIARRIEAFEREAPSNQQWLAAFVREHGALPLYSSWTESIGIKPDGELVTWATEPDWPGVRRVDEFLWAATALVRGAQRYPELQSLIPARPAASETCTNCGGTGILFAQMPQLDCVCGNLGWIPTEESSSGAG